MGKFKDSKGNVILDLDNYIIGQANLTFESSDTLTKVVGFSKEVEQVIFSIVGNASNPRDQVYRAYAQIGWNDSKKNVNFIVKGGGFA